MESDQDEQSDEADKFEKLRHGGIRSEPREREGELQRKKWLNLNVTVFQMSICLHCFGQIVNRIHFHTASHGSMEPIAVKLCLKNGKIGSIGNGNRNSRYFFHPFHATRHQKIANLMENSTCSFRFESCPRQLLSIVIEAMVEEAAWQTDDR